ncbi:M23 family peptidase [Treponema phagedenis]|uniref:M23 family metallopeptidase n=1 Tax=Treponema phagedenis TaxID=162 RepID=A0A0B7GWW6_TREPH|nr:M23 family metallopeptidase [Treponema phagedenis]QEJ95158.1 M23 family metallopeptidase [Treponema phagedenis]QEJ98604.1 M23 family metallopeptidase [Treponema phagedenis]QEK01077.1 M23 family metallopeptidase [Treponema phagedenis]QEK06085.1 M23 family metallopeptidase [Treponema phagedenis]QSH95734.1 M23 family peptidase [Treponema phagedenis]
MDIITYPQTDIDLEPYVDTSTDYFFSDKTEEHTRKKTKTFDFDSLNYDSNSDFFSFNPDLEQKKHSFHLHTKRRETRAAILATQEPIFFSPKIRSQYLMVSFILALVCTIIIFSLPTFDFLLGMYRLANIRFADDPAISKILHTNAFPEEEAKNTSQALADALPIVSYNTYTVKRGDTISGITVRYGLKNMSSILSVNNISNARRLLVGETIKVPSMDGIMHTVKTGESLQSIAGNFNIPVTALLDANDLSSQILNIGQQLFIPGAALSMFDLRKALGELFVYPIFGRFTSGFGYRTDPFTGAKSFHNGIDLAAPQGSAVKSSLDGRVAEIGFSRVYGNYIILTHSGGYQTMYGHLSAVLVRRGTYVTQGTKIGQVGNTGRSTGPHLHFSVFKNGRVLNPFTVLK